MALPVVKGSSPAEMNTAKPDLQAAIAAIARAKERVRHPESLQALVECNLALECVLRAECPPEAWPSGKDSTAIIHHTRD